MIFSVTALLFLDCISSRENSYLGLVELLTIKLRNTGNSEQNILCKYMENNKREVAYSGKVYGDGEERMGRGGPWHTGPYSVESCL